MKFSKVSFKKVSIPNGESVKCTLKSGIFKTETVVPYGTSTGKHEVFPFGKKNNIDSCITHFPDLREKSFDSVKEIEDFLLKKDSPKFPKFGGNLVLALAVSFLRLKAKREGKELFELSRSRKVPNPLSKVVGGGKHAPAGPNFQEFLIYNSKDFDEARILNLQFHEMLMEDVNGSGLDIEGGWVVDLDEESVLNAMANLRDDSFPEIKFGLDVAASSFFKKGVYKYKSGKSLSSNEQLDFISSLIKDYKLFYVEDPFNEEDFKSFSVLQKKFPKTLICGDDLLVTNPDRLVVSLKYGSCSAAIVKPNQISLLSKMFDFADKCKRNSIEPVFSHRSKESFDDFLADLSVGTSIMKIGIVGKERTAKLDRLSFINSFRK